MKRRPTKINLEQLGALLDCELPPDHAVEVAKLIFGDSELTSKLDTYQNQMVKIRTLYESILDEPVPDHLVDIIRQGLGDGNENGGNE